MTPHVTAGRETILKGGAVLKCEGMMRSPRGLLVALSVLILQQFFPYLFPVFNLSAYQLRPPLTFNCYRGP